MNTTFFSFQKYETPYYLNPCKNFMFIEESLNENTVKIAHGSEIISCFVNDDLSAKVIERLAKSGLRLIALRCAGFNNVDLKAAEQNKILVVRVPEYSPHAVAEHAVALLLSLNRKIHKAYNRVREGNFSINGLTGFDINGSTVGVIGTGKIGKLFAGIMIGFGAKVLAFDPFPDLELKRMGVDYLTLDEIWMKSDIISLHCPLTLDSHHIINADSLAKMKDGAFLINTSRGGLVESKSVISALKSGKISAFALDVYEEESGVFFFDHSSDGIKDDILARLMTFPNVLITSHQAFLTKTALQNIADQTLSSMENFSLGRKIKNEVICGLQHQD